MPNKSEFRAPENPGNRNLRQTQKRKKRPRALLESLPFPLFIEARRKEYAIIYSRAINFPGAYSARVTAFSYVPLFARGSFSQSLIILK